ncbi:MAG: hypothetical protein MJ068_01515 [Clostridia bacterium]|nr:hypothetical protein [Clostridia bacterium]
MAITLDDLLGRNRRPEQETENRTHFPTYEEFQSLRNKNTQNNYSEPVISQPSVDQESTPVFSRYDYKENSAQSINLYEFTQRDHDRLSDQEYFSKLNYTNSSSRPVFDRQESVQAVEQRHNVFTRRAEAEAEEVQDSVKKKAPLSLKGKLIIAAYVAVVATVAVLIIVNSGKLNLGKATTPSSSVSDSAIVQVIDR